MKYYSVLCIEGACMGNDDDVLKVNGRIIAGPEKVKIRSVGGAEGNTLPKNVLDALRVKVRRHRFLNITVVIDEHGRRVLVAETSEE